MLQKGFDEAKGAELLKSAYDMGVTFFDTAQIYGTYSLSLILINFLTIRFENVRIFNVVGEELIMEKRRGEIFLRAGILCGQFAAVILQVGKKVFPDRRTRSFRARLRGGAFLHAWSDDNYLRQGHGACGGRRAQARLFRARKANFSLSTGFSLAITHLCSLAAAQSPDMRLV